MPSILLMPSGRAVVVASSAGGVQALQTVIAGLPGDLPASIFVVQHLAPTVRSALPDLLNRSSCLPVAHGSDAELIQDGRIYIAPPDRHMVIDGTRIRLTGEPRENNLRPSADVLFRSAARTYGAGTVGVVLTGALDDGTDGMIAIKAAGGYAVVQDPEDAAQRGMPASVLMHVEVDRCEPVHLLADAIVDLLNLPPVAPRRGELSPPRPGANPEEPFTCPDCGGPITRSVSGETLTRYSCMVGHQYSEDAFALAHDDARERALWAAHRLLRQRVLLHRNAAKLARQRGRDSVADRLTEAAADAQEDALLLRELITGRRGAGRVAPEDTDASVFDPETN